MKRKQWLISIVIILAIVAVYLAQGHVQTNHAFVDGTGARNDDELAKLERALEIIEEQYVEEVDRDTLIEGAIEGMLQKLDDPYSVYMDPETVERFVESLGSHFEGIGAEVSMQDGKVTIVAPFKESPAEKAGLLPNDKIIKIDGEPTEGLSLYEAVLKIRGEKGTTVRLTIERPGTNELFDVTVTRDEIPIETVRTDLIERDDKTFGLIEITSFSEETAKEFEKALNELEKQGIDGLLIDVRGNPGGYLDAVRDIGNLLIPKGKPIVQIENRHGEKVRYQSSLAEPKPYPIIGIADETSASASEILMAALIEAGHYDVVGETTFGKGTVQQSIQLGDGSELKLSLYRWLTSDGNNINGKGVEPTVKVKQPDYFYVPPLSIEEPLKREMMNEQIKSAQVMLKGIGLETGRTDGFFDEQTEKAVIAFQQSHDLPVTGEIDKETATKLQDKILEKIRAKENDRQLQTAIELLIEQAK